jgi:hypothetical protein
MMLNEYIFFGMIWVRVHSILRLTFFFIYISGPAMRDPQVTVQPDSQA